MWSFKKNEIDKFIERELTEFKLQWPIGKKFKYLGVDMTVYRNYKLIHGLVISEFVNYLSANYVDKNGVIHTISFSPSELINVEDLS